MSSLRPALPWVSRHPCSRICLSGRRVGPVTHFATRSTLCRVCLLKKDPRHAGCPGGWPRWRECCGASRAVSVRPWLVFVTCPSPALTSALCSWVQRGGPEQDFKTPLSPSLSIESGKAGRGRPERVGGSGASAGPLPSSQSGCRRHRAEPPPAHAAGPRLRCVGAEPLATSVALSASAPEIRPACLSRANRNPLGLSCLIFPR